MSDDAHKDLVEKELTSQLKLGHYVVGENPPLITSELGKILKDNKEEVRIIHDGSRPVDASVNDYSTLNSVRYQTLEHACSRAKQGSYMAYDDLKSAYRYVPIHPSHHCPHVFNGHLIILIPSLICMTYASDLDVEMLVGSSID